MSDSTSSKIIVFMVVFWFILFITSTWLVKYTDEFAVNNCINDKLSQFAESPDASDVTDALLNPTQCLNESIPYPLVLILIAFGIITIYAILVSLNIKISLF